MILLTILAFVIILGLLVFVHELGHFIMAKRAGMRVDEFAFGFPPRMFGIKRGETVYAINWIPLGGYVKIVGEDGDSDDPRSFMNKGFWARFSTLIAGVVMNVILAWVLLSIGVGIGLPAQIDEGQQLPAHASIRDVSVGILEVEPNTPAANAGIKTSDFITQINNQDVTSIEQAQSLTKQNAGKPTEYTIKRGSETMMLTITPRANPPEGQGALGVALGSIGFLSYPWYLAPIKGLQITWDFLALTVNGFATILGKLFTGQHTGQALSGPIGIAILTRDYTALGLSYLLQFAALLSINLGIINAVPFPALDGGRVLFLVIEKIRGKKMNPRTEQWANTIGFSLLILLILVVSVGDVSRHLQGFKNLFQKIF